jgi:hypothetical protein
MRRISVWLISSVAVIMVCLSCHGGIRRIQDAQMAPEFMPREVGGWILDPETQVFRGDSLFEYIDGAAEMYHKYGFLEVTAVEYAKGEGGITADVYEFTSPEMAYGMYTNLRPDGPDTIMLGVEGFTLGSNLVFVKGKRLVNVYSYDESEEVIPAVRAVAEALAGKLEGTTAKPALFGIFPEQGRVPFSEKIYAEAFLGHGFLTGVYSVDYAVAGQAYTLFAMDDPGAAKFAKWSEGVVSEWDPDVGYQHLPFDGSRFLVTTDPYHGGILAGVQGGRLVGMVGYRKEYAAVMSRWLHAIIVAEPK